jgi:hypothetical protein
MTLARAIPCGKRKPETDPTKEHTMTDNPHPAEQLAAELATCSDLLDYLNVDGCQEVRRRLRHPDTIATGVGTQVAIMRAGLLDRVCRRLVALGSGSLDYYGSVGDLMPVVPDRRHPRSQ